MLFNVSKKKLFASIVASAALFNMPVPALAGMPSKDEVKTIAQNSLKDMQVFSSQAQGFSINFPASWSKVEPKEGPIVCKFLVLNGLASFRVAVDSLPEGMTLNEYFKLTTDQVKTAMAAENMPVTLLSESDSKLAGEAAKRSVYTFSIGDSSHIPRTEQYLAIKGKKGYVFNYTADSAVFDEFRPVIDAVMNSMEFH